MSGADREARFYPADDNPNWACRPPGLPELASGQRKPEWLLPSITLSRDDWLDPVAGCSRCYKIKVESHAGKCFSITRLHPAAHQCML